MRKILILFLMITLYGCSGQKTLFNTDPQYLEPVPFIYELGANSTIRNQEAVLTFYNENNAEYREYGIITILDKKHRNEGRLELYYDRFRELDYIKVQIRNNFGAVINTYTIKDAKDYSASGSNFFTDVRVKVVEAYHYSYPYTVEYEYKYKYSGSLNLPGWYPRSYEQSLEKASFEIIDYSKGNVRYYSRNIDKEPIIDEYPNYTRTKWDIDKQMAQKREVYSPSYSEIFPNVLTSASNFKVENSSGDASSWQSFGRWYYELSEGKRGLPEAAKREIDQLLEGIDKEYDKVIKLYEYMQNQTRYVSIQLGLGGWEPYSAEFVYQNKYGDCKALVNFMQAILEYANIEAEPALIRSGLLIPKVIEDFPSNQFNHVILRVTLADGSVIWLECTSKYIKPGRIGTGNEGKHALVVNQTGGQLIKTTLSKPEENNVYRFVEMKLMEDGSAEINSIFQNKGAMDDRLLHQLKPISQKKREEWLEESISLNDFDLLEYTFFGLDEIGDTGYQTRLKARDYASTSSKRLFIPVNELNKWRVYIPDEKIRITPLQLPYKFSEVDSVVFQLPPGYSIESLPGNTSIEYEFGKFSLSLNQEDGKVSLKRELIISEKDLPKEEYENFKDFFTVVSNADQSRFVIVRE